ncbi:MAG: hypothetical protein P8177_05585 [Gemmatimonadota bacterium]|jgi:hypothetical protein
MTARWKALTLVLSVALVPALGACGGDEDEAAEAPATMEEATVQPRVTDVAVGSALGPDMRVPDAAASTAFSGSDTIYVSVATEGTQTGATLTARWTYEDGQLVDEASQMVSSTGPSVTEFHISNPDGFPAGGYEVEIHLDGQSVASRNFTVQ